MGTEEAIKEANKILGSKVKFRRALIILAPIVGLVAYGIYSGAIVKIFAIIFGGK